VRLPTYFISHGGGPWPWMDGPFRRQFDRLDESLKAIVRELGAKPRAVLVITGHWEEDRFTVQSAAQPGMIYDYGGFPEHTYRIRYAAPGEPAVARRVKALLEQAGIAVAEDPERGFDHGTFTPLYSMYPEADVPVVQLSIKRGYDPGEHLAVGRALAPLRDEGVLIVGSGLSYHTAPPRARRRRRSTAGCTRRCRRHPKRARGSCANGRRHPRRASRIRRKTTSSR
jgi:aromatic ring-opening dioxygenase catalytic subunit (LigB family)